MLLYTLEDGIYDIDRIPEVIDDVRYAVMSRPMTTKNVVSINPGSFQAERSRYIKAKKMAKRRGITMSQAYGRVH